jgi:anaerobic magnesium-protoporphyrin IX monomethyl ester cyclase
MLWKSAHPMRVGLIYPPSCDPTAPYLAVPTLTGFLRERGHEVVPIDANVEAWDDMLAAEAMARIERRIAERIADLERRPSLGHAEQLEYAAAWAARDDARRATLRVDEAKRTLRDPDDFYRAGAYDAAVTVLEGAQRAISAAYHPLAVDFTAYRTPFGLTTPEEIAREAEAERFPFHDWVVETLAPRLRRERVGVVGISVCFPGQLQPAYAFAHLLRRALPGVHLTCGGPGMTQMLIRLSGKRLARALGPFDTAIVYEGEHPLAALAQALERGDSLRGIENVVQRDALLGARVVPGHGMVDLRELPAPDFDGLPLDRYFSPEPMLPYDPTRGCYWGKCTFCHYGLAEVGTAKYRERDVAVVVDHLRALSTKHGTKRFYFSQDSVAPKTLLKLSHALVEAKLDLRWATDLKPEKYLTADRARVLRDAGAVACALGVESGDARVLDLIDKGAPIEAVSDVITHLAAAGVAPEAMCFTEFPTETGPEAKRTIAFLREHGDRLGVFIVGEFGLTHGSLVAQDPGKFGIDDVWQLEGDELGLSLFFEERRASKTARDRRAVERDLADLASRFVLRSYPWAGAVSTTHTILYYDRFGPGAFRTKAAAVGGSVEVSSRAASPKFDVAAAMEAAERDRAIWTTLVHERRAVSRALYDELASSLPSLRPRRVRARTAPPRGAGAAVVEARPPRRKNTRPNALRSR